MTAAPGGSADALAAVPVTVEVDSGGINSGLPSEAEMNTWVRRALAGADYDPGGPVEVALRIVTESEMQALNSTYRGKDAPTNVLAFPAAPVDGLPSDVTRPLGDIVVCAAVVAREASGQSKRVGDHWAHLLVHGTLHLLGHDHLEPADAVAMEALERRILAAAGIRDPYAA